MVYTTMNVSQTGSLDYFLVYIATNIPGFPLYLLLTIGFIVFLTTYYGTKKYAGEGSFWSPLMAGLFVADICGTIMTLTPNIINTFDLVWIFAINIIVAVLYLFAKD